MNFDIIEISGNMPILKVTIQKENKEREGQTKRGNCRKKEIEIDIKFIITTEIDTYSAHFYVI